MYKLFFLGAGKMATALAGGVVKKQVYAVDELAAFDVSAEAAAAFTAATGVKCFTDNAALHVKESSTVLLAVKPQVLRSALKDIEFSAAQNVLSIVAGMPLRTLQELTNSKRIIRVMPNTPALVGEGAAGFAPSAESTADDLAQAGRILGAVGLAKQVPESQLDAVTGLSGSGPAYVFEFIRALADGGVAEGLSRDNALLLAAQTVLGSAKMVLETGEHPSVLKDKVTSPAGTTIRGLELLADRAFAGAVTQAVRAGAERSRELGK